MICFSAFTTELNLSMSRISLFYVCPLFLVNDPGLFICLSPKDSPFAHVDQLAVSQFSLQEMKTQLY